MPDVIAPFGEVRVYRWNGFSSSLTSYPNDSNNQPDGTPGVTVTGYPIGVFWPQGHDPSVTGDINDWSLGVQGPVSDWEGVSPSP